MNDKKKIIQGRWWKLKDKISKTIEAKYDKIKDWKMDPKGYFLIKLDKDSKLIRVIYCTFTDLNKKETHNMEIEITGNTGIDIVNTLIKEKLISTLQHAADMGIELTKAEIALKYNLEYIQDKDLKL